MAVPILQSGRGVDEDKSEPEDEQNYDSSVREFYRLWCTRKSSSIQERHQAANTVATRWKAVWYGEPFNAAFHEVGSFDLLALIGITRRIPTPLASDPAFTHDWLEDCSDRCFMIYGDDDPDAPKERARFLRLREEVMRNLHGPAARPVVTMLKTAKTY